MHILLLSHYFPPEVNAPASRTYEHARTWVQEPDTQVTVLTNHPNHPYGILYPGYRNNWLTCEEKDGIQVRRVKTYLAPNAGFARRILNYLFYMVAAVIAAIKIPKSDVVVATSPQFFCAVAGYLISRLKSMDVGEVGIQTEDDAVDRSADLAALEHRFKGHEQDAFMMEVKRLFQQYFTEEKD